MPPIYLGDIPLKVYKSEQQLSSIGIGETIIEIYSPTTSFDYFYTTIDLLYIPSVKNDIYGLHYDLIDATPEVEAEASSSYTFEKDTIYSWF